MHTFPTAISLSQETQENSLTLLDICLSDMISFENHLRMAHWNSKGPHFIGLHKLYDDILDDVQEMIDTIAERMTAIGGIPNPRLAHIATITQLTPFPENVFQDTKVLEIIIESCAIVSNSSRTYTDDIAEDTATADMFTELVRILDKSLYLLQSHRSI